ncbi:MAG: hypothetical protein HQL71_12300 [Magnetococcales bacterium]|nr:hypothetical protein [Magnetococcales bacterium]
MSIQNLKPYQDIVDNMIHLYGNDEFNDLMRLNYKNRNYLRLKLVDGVRIRMDSTAIIINVDKKNSKIDISRLIYFEDLYKKYIKETLERDFSVLQFKKLDVDAQNKLIMAGKLMLSTENSRVILPGLMKLNRNEIIETFQIIPEDKIEELIDHEEYLEICMLYS